MSAEYYKILHIIGIGLLFCGLIGVLFAFATRGTLQKGDRVFLFAMHGIGLLFIVVSGFGMLARMGLTAELPSWAYAKLIIWILLALGISAAKRLYKHAKLVTLAFVLLLATAATIAILKPM